MIINLQVLFIQNIFTTTTQIDVRPERFVNAIFEIILIRVFLWMKFNESFHTLDINLDYSRSINIFIPFTHFSYNGILCIWHISSIELMLILLEGSPGEDAGDRDLPGIKLVPSGEFVEDLSSYTRSCNKK